MLKVNISIASQKNNELKKTLFLIDIEGNEFNFFNEENINGINLLDLENKLDYHKAYLWLHNTEYYPYYNGETLHNEGEFFVTTSVP